MIIPRSLAVVGFIFFLGLASAAAVLLPRDEVESLQAIASKLGKRDWNFSVDPCSGMYGWLTPPSSDLIYENNVTCDCTFVNNTVCHVVKIVLKAQNLDGTVPHEINRLPFLRVIDLTRNYLNGTIPPEWGSMQLTYISLFGNRVTGPIPKELGNISTLTYMSLEFNQLSGPIPPELGNLSRIEKLLLTSNYLTGELPVNLAKLSTLTQLRVSDNNFQGSIPNFMQNWTNIEQIFIQGSGLSGPIPLGIDSLTKLTDLRISDLNGNDSTFPPLNNLEKFQYLILRRCNIIGDLPNYLSSMIGLTALDLSFNKLSGPIPDSFDALRGVKFIYLTGNDLSGPLPHWMPNEGKSIDLSYNNFTSDSIPSCPPVNLNLFASTKANTSGIIPCANIYRCEKPSYSLHINCGGRQVSDDRGITYEEDSNQGGASTFYQSKANWGFSSTGYFLDSKKGKDSYILQNSSSISGPNPQLYTDARLSPLSLTYYGFCMMNGSYTVNLHFAEILFTNNRSYTSLGRRLFDVYVQGNMVLKDFNIEDQAGGVNMGITMSFNATVSDNRLDIRFYWAGKGTTRIPVPGVYGPLISAISVEPNFPIPPETKNSTIAGDFPTPSENKNSIATGAIAGIVIGVFFAIFLVLAFLWWIGCFKRKDTLENELRGVDLKTGSFTLRQIKAATNNFDPSNKIGEGGFGPVYKGVLSDGVVIAVKQLSSKSNQGNREFLNEIGVISAIQHPNLVKLYGCCIEGNQLMLIYEYLENNSLARALFGREEHQLQLDWPTRHRICIGIARGLAYLHEESRLKIVHRDIKATNILLDKNLTPKISDFGLAKLDEEENTHISTRIAGTIGYMAPEYALRGYLTDKADVYSFGVVLLEIVSGRSNSSTKAKAEKTDLLEWANSLKLQGELLDLMDPRLESNFDKGEVITTIKVALLCTNPIGPERPSMSIVVSMLEGKYKVDFDSSSSFKKTNAERQSVTVDVPWTASSAASTNDLYPIDLDTEYWDKR